VRFVHGERVWFRHAVNHRPSNSNGVEKGIKALDNTPPSFPSPHPSRPTTPNMTHHPVLPVPTTNVSTHQLGKALEKALENVFELYYFKVHTHGATPRALLAYADVNWKATSPTPGVGQLTIVVREACCIMVHVSDFFFSIRHG
jgi:hypothetical protein